MSPTKEFLSFPQTPGTVKSVKIDRRASVEWVRSPVSPEMEYEMGEEFGEMSPVPCTPAPESIAAFAAGEGCGDETIMEAETPYFLKPKELLQRTAPPKQQNGGKGYGELGMVGGESKIYEEGVMQRLLLARRKSLQWAPKVGSPLGK